MNKVATNTNFFGIDISQYSKKFKCFDYLTVMFFLLTTNSPFLSKPLNRMV